MADCVFALVVCGINLCIMYQRERDPSLHRGLVKKVKCLTRLLILVTITPRLKFATVKLQTILCLYEYPWLEIV